MAPVAAADRRGRFSFNDCHADNLTRGFVTARFALYLLWFRWFLRTTTMPFHHKNIRLARKDYVGKGWFFITLCSANRSKLFTTARVCDWVLRCFRDNASSHFFAVHAYCLMPDHVHLLLEGREPSSDLLQVVRAIKLKTSMPFERKTGRPLWQKKFYDHILRRNDSPDAVAWYIWMNPVRAGLCHRPDQYPFLGSLTGSGRKHRFLMPRGSLRGARRKRPRKSGAATRAPINRLCNRPNCSPRNSQRN